MLAARSIHVGGHYGINNMSDKRRFSDMNQHSQGVVDNPPYSRLFIICSKSVTEETLRAEFGKFGTIEELWMVKDRQTGESKGVLYIKFAKTSAAAKGLEAMNGKPVDGCGRPIKVMIAHRREEGSKKEALDVPIRLFVVCKKTTTVEDLEDHFQQFGDLDSVKLVMNRETNESKGFAYVKYFKMSHAALAFENCDRSYRPKFAEPKPQPNRFGNGYEAFDRYETPPSGFAPPAANFGNASPNTRVAGLHSSVSNFVNNYATKGEPFTKLQVLVSPAITQEQLWRMFDLLPGLEFCRIFPDFRSKAERLLGSVTYQTPQQAAYARDKLHGFEYPPGQPMIVRPDYSENTQQIPPPSSASASSFPSLSAPAAPLTKSDIETLAENVKQATALLKAHAGVSGISPASYDPHYCTAKLPPPSNKFDDQEPCGAEARIFVVFNPNIPERYALKDVFGRFGKITDIFLLSGKNVGYITYARKESVADAINALHGQELCGIYMKVLEAEPRRGATAPDDDRRKRQKMQDD